MQTARGITTAPTLDDVLRHRLVEPVYQPIVELESRTVVAAEALARGPVGSALQYPDRLFDAAREADRLGALDLLCAERAIECAMDGRPAPPLLFVNAEPSVLDQPLSPRLIELLVGGLPFRMVLEYTERALPTVPGALLRLAGQVEAFGNGIALDDVGADPMSLAFLALIEPEVVKLDMHLLREPGSARTVETYRMARAFADRTDAIVLAEGIETEADLAVARRLGATWGQGWLFGRPAPIAELDFSAAGTATVRPPQLGLHQPEGAPFDIAAARGTVVADAPGVWAAEVASMCAPLRAGDHSAVLAVCADRPTTAAATALLGRLAAEAAYVNVTGPALGETVVAVVRPDAASALCGRPDRGELVRTDDPGAALAVARIALTAMG